jgi:hypothetical protein
MMSADIASHTVSKPVEMPKVSKTSQTSLSAGHAFGGGRSGS